MGPYVITVANRKGGTGKTTSSLHVAVGLAAAGYRVLLLDLDRQGHCAHALGLRTRPSDPSAHDIAEGGARLLLAGIRQTGIERLDLIPAGHGGDRPAPRGASPGALREALSKAGPASRYDAVVIDTAPGFDEDMVMALAAADAVLVPFLPHPLSLEGIRQFSRIFLMVRMKINPMLQNFGLVGCQVNHQSLLHRQVLQTVEHEFGRDKLVGTIRADIRIAEAVGRGGTAIAHAPRSRGAEDYNRLVARIAEDWIDRRSRPALQKSTAARSS